MKTIKNSTEIIRVKDEEAFAKVKNDGFSFCKKSEWKQKVRDKDKKVEKVEKKVEKKAEVKEVKEVKEDTRPKSAGYEKYKARKEGKEVKAK